jgi:hypothetical protein
MKKLLPLILISGSALAGEPPVHQFECDTPPGHYSYWTRSLSSGDISVEGTIAVNELRADKRWHPTVLISFSSNSPGERIGLQIYTLGSGSDELHLRVLLPGKDNEELFATISRTEKLVPFTVSLSSSGTLKVTAAGHEHSAEVKGFTAEKLQLSCSTGDFEFQQIRVTDPG